MFFKYGDDITEQTKHEYNTDYTIHKLFAQNKKICSYSFNTRKGYNSTLYWINHKKRILDKRKRSLVEDYFKEKPLKLYKRNSEISAKSK